MRVVLDRKGAGQLGPGQLWHLPGRTVPGFEGQGHLQRVSGVPGWDDPPGLQRRLAWQVRRLCDRAVQARTRFLGQQLHRLLGGPLRKWVIQQG